MQKEVKSYKLKVLPNNPIPNAILYIKSDTDNEVSMYITDFNGVPFPLKDEATGTGGIQTISNSDGTISVLGTNNTVLNLSTSIKNIINSALQPGANISELVNDENYITLADIPSQVVDLQATPSATNVIIENTAGTDATILAATTTNAGVLLPTDKIKLDNTTNINSGDQTSIVGITSTKAQFNTSVTDGDFLFVGDVITTPDATTTIKGIVKLAGDLAGTADLPTVPALATKAIDANVIHTTGNETKAGNLTLSNNLIVSKLNASSGNQQTGIIEGTDPGSIRNNIVLRTPVVGGTAANIRLQVDEIGAHIGFNKTGTVNSSLAFMLEQTSTEGRMDFRGTNFLSGADATQATRIGQSGDNFFLMNLKSGGIYFKAASNANNAQFTNAGNFGIGGSAVTSPLDKIHVDNGNIRIGGTVLGSLDFYNTGASKRGFLTLNSSSLDLGTSTAQAINFNINNSLVGSFNSSGYFVFNNTPATSAGSFDLISMNASGVAEKVLNSGFLHTVGNENFAGVKSATNTGASQINGLSLTNSGTSTSRVLNIVNSGSGFGVVVSNTTNGVAEVANNNAGGVLKRLNSQTGATGNLMEFQENGANATVINYQGKITTIDASLTGTPTAPTASPGTNTTQLATTAFVQDAVKIPIGTIRLKSYTVATLPTGVEGDTAYVTDATAPTYLGLLIGGGAVKCPVFYNGTAWVSH